jgi:hypothetical protein
MQQGEAASQRHWTESEYAAIVDETERILADPAFKSSKRCMSLFRRLIDRALAGDLDGTKERTLGIEVFGRDASYDTATDPVVRVTANEIRKRLGQWYQEPDHAHSVRIRLVAGSYLPQFEFKPLVEAPEIHEEAPPVEVAEHHADVAEPAVHTEPPPAVPARRLKKRYILWAAAALAILIAAGLIARSGIVASNESLIWAPLTRSSDPLTLCISDEDWEADARAKSIDPISLIARVIDSREVPSKPNTTVFASTFPVIDAFLANKITNRIAIHGKQTILRRSSELSFDDLRHEPVVMIGGFNPWSLILLSKLRYSVRVDPVSHQKWIRDAQNPSSRNWTVADSIEHLDVDYAIVSRFRDAETGQWIISLGGLWPHGTISACSLLTDSEYAYMLPRAFHSNQNAQLVLKTNVINGVPGPPKVIAVYTW